MSKQFRDAAAELVGRLLYAAVKDAGITQQELANRTGIAHSKISLYVNSRSPCTVATLIELLAACNLEILDLRCTKNGTADCVVLKNA